MGHLLILVAFVLGALVTFADHALRDQYTLAPITCPAQK